MSTAMVYSLAILQSKSFFPSRLLACGCDGYIKIYDTNNESDTANHFILVARLEHTGAVRSLAVLPGHRLASGSDDGTVKIWDLSNGYTLDRTIVASSGPRACVYALAVLENGHLASCCTSSGTDIYITIWDPNTGEMQKSCSDVDDNKRTSVTHNVTHSNQTISALAVLPNGLLASGSASGHVLLRNIKNDTVMKLEGHTGFIQALAVLPNSLLASAGQDKSILIWDYSTGVLLKRFVGHKDAICSLIPIGANLLASGSFDGFVKIWSLNKSIEPLVATFYTGMVNNSLVTRENMDGSLIIKKYENQSILAHFVYIGGSYGIKKLDIDKCGNLDPDIVRKLFDKKQTQTICADTKIAVFNAANRQTIVFGPSEIECPNCSEKMSIDTTGDINIELRNYLKMKYPEQG